MRQLWESLDGQERARRLLVEAARRPGGSYLFVGPSGAGKSEAAGAFAAAILCPDACGVCSVCRGVLGGTHPDVQRFQPEGFTYPIELIREVVASAAQTPLEARLRVLIIEQADRIAERSQNALLKALEEPGRPLTWVLVADSLEPILPTVASRCQIIEFSALSEEALERLVQSRCGVVAEDAALLVRMARGDLSRALALAGEEHSRALRALALDAAATMGLGAAAVLAFGDRVRGISRAARDKAEQTQGAELHRIEELLGSGGAGMRRRIAERHKRSLRRIESEVFLGFLVWLALALRDLAALCTGADSTVAAVDRVDDLRRAAATMPPGFWLEMIEATASGQRAIGENANPPLVVESVLLRLAAPRTDHRAAPERPLLESRRQSDP